LLAKQHGALITRSRLTTAASAVERRETACVRLGGATMSVESAVAYIRRMREDPECSKHLNDSRENEAANWTFVKQQGYDYAMSEFKQARDALYKKYGVDVSAGF
jgi:hypothetical protein